MSFTLVYRSPRQPGIVAAAAEGDGFPDASNTGVPVGSVLTPHSGDLFSSANDQVIELLDHSGSITVTHDRVTVRKCRVNGPGGAGNFVVVYLLGCDDCVVEDCTITNGVGGGKAVLIETATGCTVQRCDLSVAEDGVYLGGSGHIIRDNYIHDLLDYPGRPEPAHSDGIQSDSTDTLIEHNAVRAKTHPDMSSGITNGPCSNMTITNNLFQGGAYILRIEIAGSSGCVVTNNRLEFGVGTSGYLDLTGTNGTTPALVISGNADYVTGAPITWP